MGEAKENGPKRKAWGRLGLGSVSGCHVDKTLDRKKEAIGGAESCKGDRKAGF